MSAVGFEVIWWGRRGGGVWWVLWGLQGWEGSTSCLGPWL